MSDKSFHRTVWEKLSSIDVSEFTQEKGRLTYLSWVKAWSLLMEVYPESRYEQMENECFPDNTVSVAMRVVIKEGENEFSREMYLQVLNHKCQPLENPSSHAINNARMRCLTKAIAMCGLGVNIYMGEDVPQAEELQKVVKEPRIPHDEMLRNMCQKYDEAKTFNELKMRFKNDWPYFGEKKWNSKDHQEYLKEHYEKIKATFPEEERDAEQAA